MMGEKSNVYRILIGKPLGNSPLERPRKKHGRITFIFILSKGSGV
jgi:hypothetical protein